MDWGVLDLIERAVVRFLLLLLGNFAKFPAYSACGLAYGLQLMQNFLRRRRRQMACFGD